MTTSFYGSPYLEGIRGLCGRIFLRLASGEIKEPITSSKMRRHFANEHNEYQDALRELEVRNCIRLEKQMNKRGPPSILVRINPHILTTVDLNTSKVKE
ncbi:hypothetical protein DEMA109039_19535 [Deinococcus marmoris]